MPIITISQGSYSMGQEVAQLVAKKLGVPSLARDVVLEASEQYDVPEVKLVNAIENPPSILDRLFHGKDGYIAYIRAALLKHFQKDDLVYHGLLGHYFLPEVSHVVKVRVLADPAIRTAVVMKRDSISESEAQKVLEKGDHGRRQWAMHLYGIDPADPHLYDLIVRVGRVTADDAADMICHFSQISTFQATRASRARVDDLALAAEVTAILHEHMPGVEVSAIAGNVVVTVPHARVRAGFSSDFAERFREDAERRIRELTLPIDRIKMLEISLLDQH